MGIFQLRVYGMAGKSVTAGPSGLVSSVTRSAARASSETMTMLGMRRKEEADVARLACRGSRVVSEGAFPQGQSELPLAACRGSALAKRGSKDCKTTHAPNGNTGSEGLVRT